MMTDRDYYSIITLWEYDLLINRHPRVLAFLSRRPHIDRVEKFGASVDELLNEIITLQGW